MSEPQHRSGVGEESQRADSPQELLDSAIGHAIVRLTADGRIESWPDPARELYGYDAETAVGRPLDALGTDVPEDRSDIDGLLENAAARPVEAERWHTRADGTEFWALMRLSPLQSGAGYVLVVQDLTDRKRDEDRLQTQNDRLREFTGVLSHDLRSPLTVLSGSLERYRETGDPAALDTIEETTERMDRLIEDLLRIARHGEDLVDPEPTDLLPVIEVAKRGTCPDSNPLRYEQVPQLSADSDRLCQLFENLFRNVREHAGPDARIRIGPLEDGFYVADDGPGIDADVAEQVFEHGYSTAEQGTGFGLSLVRRFATAHDWDVGVDENAVGGAMFRFTGVEFVD